MSFSSFDFGFKPLGKGKLNITLPSIQDTDDNQPSPPPPSESSEDSCSKLICPFDRDLSGFELDSMSSVCLSSSHQPNTLETKWKQAGVPPEIITLWLTHSTLGYAITCIKNPNNCEPKSLIFCVGKNFKVGFDQRDGINIFFLAWRHHLTIDLDDEPGCESQKDLFVSRLKLLSEFANTKNLTFAIYRTDRGYHAIELSSTWDPTDPKVLSITRLVGGDVRYAAISSLQGWRLRLTPKSKTPNDFVVRPIQDDFQNYRICPRLKTLIVGNGDNISNETVELMQLYLELSRVMTDFVRDKLEIIQTNIMLNSNIAYTIRDLILATLKPYPSLSKDIIWNQPFKSVSLMFESFLG